MSKDQRGALAPDSVKDGIDTSIRPDPKRKPAHAQAFVVPKKGSVQPAKDANKNLGSSRDHFQSISHLKAAFGKDFFPYNKPLMFLKSKDSTIFVLAKPYLEEWKSETNERLYHNQTNPRSVDLVAGYVHPTSGKEIDLGPAENYLNHTGGKNHLAALLSLPGGDSENIDDERELTTLAQCMFCFDVGRHVERSPEIAQSLDQSLRGKGIMEGIHMALHHASASDDLDEAIYFLSKGGDPKAIWDGNHEHALDVAVRNSNGPLVSAFLSTFTTTDIAYLRYLLGNRDYESIDMVAMIRARVTSLELTKNI